MHDSVRRRKSQQKLRPGFQTEQDAPGQHASSTSDQRNQASCARPEIATVSYTLSPDNLPTQSLRDLIASRLHAVEQRIIGACHRAGRQRADVTLVAVTKSVSVEVAALLVELGVLHLGESRPQELWRKRPALPNSVRWHLVGHLQRNKIERTLPVHLVHSVDRISLLTALDEEAGKRALQVDALLEVNASGERSKMGFSPEELSRVVPEIAKLKSVRVKGLMAMAAPFADPERVPTCVRATPQFA